MNKRASGHLAGGLESRAKAHTLGLLLILALALGLRLAGLRFGLPAVYNPDEMAILNRALAFATGDLNPHNFLYPTFFFYVLFAWIGGFFVAGRLTGAFASVAAFTETFFTDPTGIYLAGRTLGALCGVLAVAATYALARRVFDRTTALVAALFLATAPFHVRDSHYIKHDVPVSLAIAVAYLFLIALATSTGSTAGGKDDRLKRAVLAGLACGVAFSTHYYTIFLALPLALSVLLATRDGHSRESTRAGTLLLAAGAAATVAFFALSPFLLAEPATAWRDIVANRQIVVDRAVAEGGSIFASAGEYLGMLASEAAGWPVALLAVAGTARLLKDAPTTAALLLAFPVAFLTFIVNTVAASRYLDPVLPLFSVLAAHGAVQTGGWLTQLSGSRTTGALEASPKGTGAADLATTGRTATLALVLAGLACLPGLAGSVRSDRFFQQTDTRTLAQEFIEHRVPAGSTILVQPYSVMLAQSRESLVEALTANLGDAGRASRKFQLRLNLAHAPSPAYRTIYLGDGGLDQDKIYVGYSAFAEGVGLAALSRLRVEYVILKRYNDPDRATLPFLDALAREGRLIARFSPYRAGQPQAIEAGVEPYLHNTDARIDAALERPGPVVEIWQLNDVASPTP